MSTRSKLKELVGKIEGTQALMIAYVTGERANTQPAEYQELYYQLNVDLEELGYANPGMVQNPGKLDIHFWRQP